MALGEDSNVANDLVMLSFVRNMCKNGTARMIRMKAGLSLAEVGSALDPPVGAPTVLRWERGERAPHGEKALAYGRLLEELAKRTD